LGIFERNEADFAAIAGGLYGEKSKEVAAEKTHGETNE
jgi:hypothetical protein